MFRDHSGDRPAYVAHVYPGEGSVMLTVLGPHGQWFTRDRIARDVERNDGGIPINGMWRWPGPDDEWK